MAVFVAWLCAVGFSANLYAKTMLPGPKNDFDCGGAMRCGGKKEHPCQRLHARGAFAWEAEAAFACSRA